MSQPISSLVRKRLLSTALMVVILNIQTPAAHANCNGWHARWCFNHYSAEINNIKGNIIPNLNARATVLPVQIADKNHERDLVGQMIQAADREATKDLMKNGDVAKKAGTFLHDIAKTSPKDATRYSNLIGESAGKTIKTPYGNAVQEISREALDAREAAKNGAPMYRGVKNGVSNRAEAQFWSLEHPKSSGYADRYGIPPKNMDFDGVDAATVKNGEDFVTRPSPAVESNVGGGIEIVVNPGDIENYTQGPF